MFFCELNATDNVKYDKQKCNRILDEGGMELVHCICDCVHNVSQDNIPLEYDDKKILKRHKECLRKLVNKKTSYREKKATHTGRLIPRVPHPYACRISRKTVHWTIMDEMKRLLLMDLRTC